jgi:hypothetical protein
MARVLRRERRGLPTPPARVRAMHLVALSAFGIAQPAFNLLKNNPDYFAVERFYVLDVVLFAVGLVVAPPVILFAVELAAQLVHPRLVSITHNVFVAALAFLAVGRALQDPSPTQVLLAVGAGIVFAFVYGSWAPARTFLSISVLAPAGFLCIFLINAPLGQLAETDVSAAAIRGGDARTPVVLVIFDEFPTSSLMKPSRAIDAARYPNFAALARSSAWYRSATAVNDYTTWDVPAILSGIFPRHDQLPLLADYPRNLYTLLGGSYRIHDVEPVTNLCPRSLCRDAAEPLATRIRKLVPDVGKTMLTGRPNFDVPAWRNPPGEATRFLAGLRPTPSAQLDVLHVILPHGPWRYLPSCRNYEAPRFAATLDGDTWVTARRAVDQAYRQHLLQVGCADHVLGQVIHRLRSLGLWDRALFIVTADEGVNVVPGEDERTVDQTNIADIAPVPLFVKTPGQRRGRVDDRSARIVDIVPTVVDVLGIQTSWKFDGRSLLDVHRPHPSEIVLGSHTGGVVKTSWKHIETGMARTIARRARLVRGLDALEAVLATRPQSARAG